MDAIDLGEMTRTDGLLATLGDVSGKSVIDIGCGEGAMARALAERGATVRGYDPFIAGGDWTNAGTGRYRLAKARADEIPEPDATADIVLFVFSLHHVPRAAMAGALAEARRLLRSGGLLCVAEPVADGPAQYVMEPYHDETAVRRDAITALAAYAAPSFGAERVAVFAERRRFDGFEAYAEHARLGMRYNGYGEADITSDEVRRRFAAMATLHGGQFDQPVRVNLFQ